MFTGISRSTEHGVRQTFGGVDTALKPSGTQGTEYVHAAGLCLCCVTPVSESGTTYSSGDDKLNSSIVMTITFQVAIVAVL